MVAGTHWQSQEFIFGGTKHKIRQLIIYVYVLIISILTAMYIQFNNQNPKMYFFELPSPKLVHEPRFFKLNYHSLNIMAKILKNTNNLKIFK